MKNLSKEKRDRLVLTVVSSLVILVGLWQGVITLQKQKIVDLALKTVEQKSRVSNGKHLIASTSKVQLELDKRTQVLKEIEEGMASGDMYSWIIQKVNKFKAGYDVDIPQFSREMPTDVGIFGEFPYQAVQFNIRGKAHYHEFGRFIADFENEFPYLRVQNVVLEPASASIATSVEEEKDKDSERLAFRLEIVTLVNPNSI